jgi:hypothetical protein
MLKVFESEWNSMATSFRAVYLEYARRGVSVEGYLGICGVAGNYEIMLRREIDDIFKEFLVAHGGGRIIGIINIK